VEAPVNPTGRKGGRTTTGFSERAKNVATDILDFQTWSQPARDDAGRDVWPFDEKPWLLIGKGPSFSACQERPFNGYTFGLNHVVTRVVKLDVLHVKDAATLTDVGDALSKARWLVLPRSVDLEECRNENYALDVMARSGRVVQYDLRQGNVETFPGQIVREHSSAEAALCIIAHLRGRDVWTAGMDGGSEYAAPFALAEFLSVSFDEQMPALRDISRHYGMLVRNLSTGATL
jgi:hypothetical protein